MEGAEPLPRRLLSVLPKLTTALLLITKRAQHPKNTTKKTFSTISNRGFFLCHFVCLQGVPAHVRPKFPPDLVYPAVGLAVPPVFPFFFRRRPGPLAEASSDGRELPVRAGAAGRAVFRDRPGRGALPGFRGRRGSEMRWRNPLPLRRRRLPPFPSRKRKATPPGWARRGRRDPLLVPRRDICPGVRRNRRGRVLLRPAGLYADRACLRRRRHPLFR